MVEGVILENLFFPLSKVSFFNPDAQRIEKYWRCVSICHMGCSQSNFHQTDVIYQPLSEDATLKQQARKEPEREREKQNKEQRNDRESLLEAAGSRISDPTCYNACTQTIPLNNGEDVVTTALCIKHSQDLWLYFSSPSFLLPSRFSLLNNKGSNWWWTRFSIETSYCAFAFRLKCTIKVVRWAHYDFLVLCRSHQS